MPSTSRCNAPHTHTDTQRRRPTQRRKCTHMVHAYTDWGVSWSSVRCRGGWRRGTHLARAGGGGGGAADGKQAGGERVTVAQTRFERRQEGRVGGGRVHEPVERRLQRNGKVIGRAREGGRLKHHGCMRRQGRRSRLRLGANGDVVCVSLHVCVSESVCVCVCVRHTAVCMCAVH
jgi:hypothetical protein